MGITISREHWEALCIERTRMQRVVEAARALEINDDGFMLAKAGTLASLRTALRDLDAPTGQDKGSCPRCGGTGVEDDGSHGGIAWPNACPACTSPYKPGAPVVRRIGQRGVVVLDDDGEV